MAAPMAGHISKVVDNYENAFKAMSEEDNTQLFLESRTHHLKLAPKYLGNMKAGVKAHIKCFLSRYDKHFEGVPLAYKNVKIQQRMGRMLIDQACVHLDIAAEFIIFKPTVGCKLRGRINLVKKGHIGCLVHDCFNAWMLQSLTTQKMAADSLMGSRVDFEVVSISNRNNILSMKGKFLALVPKKGELDPGLVAMKPEKSPSRVDKFGKKKPVNEAHNQSLSIPDLDSVLDDGNETIIARGGTDLDQLDDSANDGEPMVTSTQVPDSVSETDGSRKKHKKKKKKKNAMEDSATDASALDNDSAAGNRVNDDISIEANTETDQDVKEMEGELTKIKKKKTKHKAKESNDTETTTNLLNGTASKISLDINKVYENRTACGEMSASSDQEKKTKKKKRKHSESSKDTGLEQSTEELFSPRKKLKKDKSFKGDSVGNGTAELGVDMTEESQTVSKKHKKHKHKKDKDIV